MIKYSVPIVKFPKSSLNDFYLQKIFFVFFDYIIIGFFIIYCMATFTKFKADNKEYFLKGFIYLDAKAISFFRSSVWFLKNFSSGVVLFPSNDTDYFFDICKLVSTNETGLKLVGFFFEKCYLTVSFISNFIFVEERFVLIFFKTYFQKSLGLYFAKMLAVFQCLSLNLFNMDNLKVFFLFFRAFIL